MSRATGTIGLAIGTDRITAVVGEDCRRICPSDLPALLGELSERVAPRRRVIAVALLPPLVEVKHIDLPPLGRNDAERVLARDADRYFLRGSGRQVVSAERLGRRGALWAAAAPAETVERLYGDLERQGWQVSTVVPAVSAWIAAVRQSSPRLSRGGVVALALPGSTEVLGMEDGRLVWLRRLPPGPARAVDGLDPEDRPALLIGGDSDQAPDELAARCASATGWLDLVPEDRLAAARRRTGLTARLLAGVAAGLTILAAALHWWGTGREIDQVIEARRAHAARVGEAMKVRSELEGWTLRLAGLEAAERSATRWAGVLATIAEHLPGDAYLLALRGTGDSLLLEGLAGRATASFEALQRAPQIGGVRATAPIRQEPGDSGQVREHFVLAAQLRGGREPAR